MTDHAGCGGLFCYFFRLNTMYLIRPWLYLGKFRETKSLSLLQLNGIEAMLQFAEPVEHPGIASIYLNMEDGLPISSSSFEQGTGFILAAHHQGKKVLIACSAGISRSVSFGIAALKETEEISLLDAYQAIVRTNTTAFPHQALWKSLCARYNEDIPYLEVIRKYNQANA